MKKAIIAGSFDPIHKGHLKIIEKAAVLFDEVFVVVANNDFKERQRDINTRLQEIKGQISFKNVHISALEEGYLAIFAKDNGVKYLVRSARNNTDFDYELDLAKLNREINSELETVLIIPDMEDIEYSSSKFRDYKIDPSKF